MPVKKNKKGVRTKKKTLKPVSRIIAQPKTDIISMKPSSTEKKEGDSIFAALAYLFQLLNPLMLGIGAVVAVLIYLIRGDRFTKFHAMQAFFYGVVVSLLFYVLQDNVPNGSIFIFPLGETILVVSLFVLVITLYLAFSALRKEWGYIPLLSKLATQFVKN